jgi:hypothetical protein
MSVGMAVGGASASATAAVTNDDHQLAAKEVDQALGAVYYLECNGQSGVAWRLKPVTRTWVMSCAGGVLYRVEMDSQHDVAYYGDWCIDVGKQHPSWTGWQILAGCKW